MGIGSCKAVAAPGGGGVAAGPEQQHELFGQSGAALWVRHLKGAQSEVIRAI